MTISTTKINIGIISSSDLMRQGLQLLFEKTIHICTSYSSIEQVTRYKRDSIFFLYDPREDELNIRQQITTLKNHNKLSSIIILSSCTSPRFIWNILEQGANGFLCLHEQSWQRILLFLEDNHRETLCLSPTAQKALTELQHFDGIQLTEYQRQVIQLMLQQKTAPQIAQRLDKSLDAVYQVQRRIRDSFAVNNNSELVKKLVDLGVIDPVSRYY